MQATRNLLFLASNKLRFPCVKKKMILWISSLTPPAFYRVSKTEDRSPTIKNRLRNFVVTFKSKQSRFIKRFYQK